VAEFVEHYHLERNHQGLGNQLLTAPASPGNDNAPIARRERPKPSGCCVNTCTTTELDHIVAC
jgi:hypothetical protein